MDYTIYYGRLQSEVEHLLQKQGLIPLPRRNDPGYTPLLEKIVREHASGYEHLPRASSYILRNIASPELLEERLAALHMRLIPCQAKNFIPER
jgi:hypothetical protein